MRRAQIQFEESLYKAVRRRAFERHLSVSAVVREAVRSQVGEYGLGRDTAKRRKLSFISSFSSRQGRLKPVSERHDEALAEVLKDW